MTVTCRTARDQRLETSTNWDGYLKYLDAAGEGHVRVTYDRGKLELMTPSALHERMKTLIRGLLECLLDAMDIPYEGGGSTTFKRQDLDRGLEPDECYWIRSWQAFAFNEAYDPQRDPPPDIVVEVDVTSSSVDRIDMFRVMGVAEIWRWRRRTSLELLCLGQDKQYHLSDTSQFVSAEALAALRDHLRKARQMSTGQIRAHYRRWLRKHPVRPPREA